MGDVALVTGATAGIGEAVARRLAASGATVLLGARDPAKGERVRAEIIAATSNSDVHVVLADLSSQADVRGIAAEVREGYGRVDVLVNNAGLLAPRRETTVDGAEMTLAVNYLAPFLLTNLLLDRLGRVVTVTSALHARGRIDVDELDGGRRYSAWGAYNRSKLATVLFTLELARRAEGRVRAVCVHPGTVASSFYDGMPPSAQPLIRVAKRFMTTSDEAAGAVAWLATADVADGYYVGRRPATPSRAALDPVLAGRLWDVSARLTGLAR